MYVIPEIEGVTAYCRINTSRVQGQILDPSVQELDPSELKQLSFFFPGARNNINRRIAGNNMPSPPTISASNPSETPPPNPISRTVLPSFASDAVMACWMILRFCLSKDLEIIGVNHPCGFPNCCISLSLSPIEISGRIYSMDQVVRSVRFQTVWDHLPSFLRESFLPIASPV
jgi:hypothetical protein